MSQLGVIQGIYEAFGRGDMESVLDRLHPEIEWVEPEIEGLLYGGTHRGIEAVTNEVLARIPQTWARSSFARRVDRRRRQSGCGGRVQRSR
jgi:hypothetical protein